MSTIGENIAIFRKSKGLTQEALAAAIGVSAQSVSKWENNTNMPDIMLLPVVADIFDISIDELFGRTKTRIIDNVDDAYGVCCDTLLESMLSCLYCPEVEESFEKSLKQYKKRLKTDGRVRTAILHKQGIMYYRDSIGGLILKKPDTHWYQLFSDSEAVEVLSLLSDNDFRLCMVELIKNKKTVFTVASICSNCKIKNNISLQEKLNKSGLFTVKTVDIDGSDVAIYELVSGQKLFLIFAILIYAQEYSNYEDIYTGYIGDGNYYFA